MKRRIKHPPVPQKCEGCPWRGYTGCDNVVFCILPKCRREEFRKLTERSGHGEKENH